MKKFDGGTAFPSPAFELKQREGSHGNLYAKDLHAGPLQVGMSLRDYFAAHALSITCFNPAQPKEHAEWAYMVADAMLKERAK